MVDSWADTPWIGNSIVGIANKVYYLPRSMTPITRTYIQLVTLMDWKWGWSLDECCGIWGPTFMTPNKKPFENRSSTRYQSCFACWDAISMQLQLHSFCVHIWCIYTTKSMRRKNMYRVHPRRNSFLGAYCFRRHLFSPHVSSPDMMPFLPSNTVMHECL